MHLGNTILRFFFTKLRQVANMSNLKPNTLTLMGRKTAV